MATYTDSAGNLRETQPISPPDSGLTVNTTLSNIAANKSGMAGTAAIEFAAGNSARKGYFIQNQSPTATIYVRLGAAATADQNGLRLLPGEAYQTDTYCGLSAISIIASAANTPVYMREW